MNAIDAKIIVLPDNEKGHVYLASIPTHWPEVEIQALGDLLDKFCASCGGHFLILRGTEFSVVENDPAVIAQAEALLATLKSKLSESLLTSAATN